MLFFVFCIWVKFNCSGNYEVGWNYKGKVVNCIHNICVLKHNIMFLIKSLCYYTIELVKNFKYRTFWCNGNQNFKKNITECFGMHIINTAMPSTYQIQEDIPPVAYNRNVYNNNIQNINLHYFVSIKKSKNLLVIVLSRSFMSQFELPVTQ